MSYQTPAPLWKRNLFYQITVQYVFRKIAKVFYIIALVYFTGFLGNMIGWSESCERMTLNDEVQLTLILIFAPSVYVLFFALCSRSFSTMTQKPNRFWVLLVLLQCPAVLQLTFRDYGDYPSCAYYIYKATQILLIPLFLLNSLICAVALFMTYRIPVTLDLYEVDFEEETTYYQLTYQ